MSKAAQKSARLHDPAGAKKVVRKFLEVNRRRLHQVQDVLSPRQRIFLDILPMLFHVNHPALPGYASDKVPTGLANFEPDRYCYDAVKKFTKHFSRRNLLVNLHNIYSIFMMGSCGTVAYSDKSDFDLWVCHRPQLDSQQVEALRAKCHGIEQWAATLGLEVKFFVLSPDAIRRGNIEALSGESSGSAQQLLLMEEFYRTAILISGRYPAWWLVPPGRAHEYTEYVGKLLRQRFIPEYEVIDFGDVSHIPAPEFFGATLWQLHKAIDSPYKSILKLLLMESYAAEYPQPQLLCARYKQAVYEGVTDIDALDPYVLMVRKVEEYLSEKHQSERLSFARRCFYFKVHENLSEQRRPESRRRTVMQALVKEWGWPRQQLLVLDSRETWKIDRVLEERNVLVGELTHSYRVLSDFARNNAKTARINQADLTTLGRRLYAAFERKAGKIELINPGISVDLSEQRLCFVSTRDAEQEAWSLYRADYATVQKKQLAALKRSHSLIELVAWCHFNQLIGPHTLVTLENTLESFPSEELLAIIDSLEHQFPQGRTPAVDMTLLARPAEVRAAALYVNLGIDPMASHSRLGLHLTSNRADALSYGGRWQNMIFSCDLVILNTWGEVLTSRYHGERCLLDCLTDYLAWAPVNGRQGLPACEVHCFSSSLSASIISRARELCKDLINTFHTGKWRCSARYVLRVAHDFYLLQPENDVPRYEQLRTEGELLKTLGRTQAAFSPIVVDRHIEQDMPLASLFKHNRPDVIQIFYHPQGDKAQVYILDERGSFFFQDVQYHSGQTLYCQYVRFLDNVNKRRTMMDSAATEGVANAELEFYEISVNRAGRIQVKRKVLRSTEPETHYLAIQAIADVAEGPQPRFNLYCDGKEFSSLEFGAGLYREVAAYVLSRRKQRARYPIYITDIDISRGALDVTGGPLQTVQFLEHKKKIEQDLNLALESV